MDEPEKHYAEYKKPVRKDLIMYEFTYVKFQNRQIYRDRKQINGFLGQGEGGWGNWDEGKG